MSTLLPPLEMLDNSIFYKKFIKQFDSANAEFKKIMEEDPKTHLQDLKKSLSKMIDAYINFSKQTTKKNIILPLIELNALTIITKQIYSFKKTLGATAYITEYGNEAINAGFYLNQRLKLLNAYKQSLEKLSDIRKSKRNWLANPLSNYKKLFNSNKTEYELRKTHEQFINSGLVENLGPLEVFSLRLANSETISSSINQQDIVNIEPKPDRSRDLHSLSYVLEVLKSATQINLQENPEEIDAFLRFFQIAGEHLKSTQDSPNISESTARKLRTANILLEKFFAIRNRLSHSGPHHHIIREYLTNIIKAAQADIKNKIIPVIEKVLYRIHLEDVKELVKYINKSSFTNSQNTVINKILDSKNMSEIIGFLESLKLSLNSENKFGIAQIDGILMTIKLQQPDEKIFSSEKVGVEINPPDLTGYNELLFFLNSPGQRLNIDEYGLGSEGDTKVSTSNGIMALDSMMNKNPLSSKILFENFIFYNFNEFTPLYKKLKHKNEGLRLGIATFDVSLLAIDIKTYASENSLALSDKELEALIEKFKLFNKLELKKTDYLVFLNEIKHKSFDTSLNKFSNEIDLNTQEKRLLKDSTLIIIQKYFLPDYLVEGYIETLLNNVDLKINDVEYDELKNQIKKTIKFNDAYRFLMAYANGELAMQKTEYLALVEVLNPKPLIKRELEVNFVDRTILKQITLLKISNNTYGHLKKALIEKEFSKDIIREFSKYINSLQNISEQTKKLLVDSFKKNEKARLYTFISQKLDKLQKLSSSESSEISKASCETLILDVATLWKSLLSIEPALKKLKFDRALLQGISLELNLRNFIAHGDILVDAITKGKFFLQVQQNIPKFVEDAKGMLALAKLTDDPEMTIYLQKGLKQLPENLKQPHADLLQTFKLSPNWEDHLVSMFAKQTEAIIEVSSREESKPNAEEVRIKLLNQELLQAASTGNIDKIKFCIENGATNINDALLLTAEANNNLVSFEYLMSLGAKIDPTMATRAILERNQLLLKKLAEINELHGNLLPHLAIVTGNVAALDVILKKMPHLIEEKNSDGFTPLLAAAAHDGYDRNLLINKLLRGYGADVYAKTKHGLTIVHLLSRNGDRLSLESLKTLYPNLDLNALDNVGFRPFHLAALGNQPLMLKYFSDQGIDINIRADRGFGAEQMAAQDGHIECLKVLFNSPNFVFGSTDRGETSLLIAIGNGQHAAVEFILKKARDQINQSNHDGLYPLHRAALMKDKKSVKLLIEHGADVNQEILNGVTAAQIAAAKGDLETLKSLREAGADLKITTAWGFTLLHIGIKYPEIVSYLLEHEKSLAYMADINGLLPSHIAAREGYLSSLKKIFEKDPHLRNKFAPNTLLTHLHLGAARGNDEIVEYLTDLSGIDIDAKAAITGDTPLDLSIKKGHLSVAQTLITHGAYISNRALHKAALSNEPEMISFIFTLIKDKNPELETHKILNAEDSNGYTPLMWAIETGNSNSVEAFLAQEGIDIFHENEEGERPFEIAVRGKYSMVDCTNNKSIHESVEKLIRQKNIINLIYKDIHKGHISEDKIRALQNDFSLIVNRNFREYLSKLDLYEGDLLEFYDHLQEHGLAAIWSHIDDGVQEAITSLHKDVCLIEGTEEPTTVLSDLMLTYTGVMFDKKSLKLIPLMHVKKVMHAYKQFEAEGKVVIFGGCKPGQSRPRREVCSQEEFNNQKKTYNPILGDSEAETKGTTLAVALATEEQRNQLTANIAKLEDGIKSEDPTNHSSAERKKLTTFNEYLQKIVKQKDNYLHAVNKLEEAKLIKISNSAGKIVYLTIFNDNHGQHSIYCSQINKHTLQFPKNKPLTKLLKLYANLLFPESASHSLNYEYFNIASNLPQEISNILGELSKADLDLRSDLEIIKNNHNTIEGLALEEFRALFLVNGKVPEVKQLHTGIFEDPEITISLRGEKFSERLWQMNAEQQIILARILNKYPIQIESLIISENEFDFHISLNHFNKQLIERIKTEKPITQEELKKLSREYLDNELKQQGFESNERAKMLANLFKLHEGTKESISHITGIIHQGIFIAPAFIRAMNGEPEELENMLKMIAGDMTFDSIYQTLITDPRFIRFFPKTAGILSKSVRFVASPISKILLINSFFELHHKLQNSKPGSSEHKLASALLEDNIILSSTLVAGMLGLELGPLGIIIDLGITIHQLLITAEYYRKNLPFKVTVMESLEISLGFYGNWVKEMQAEASRLETTLQQINALEKGLNTQFSHGLVNEPALVEELRTIRFEDMPLSLQEEIKNNESTEFDKGMYIYTPSKYRFFDGLEGTVKTKPIYQQRLFKIKKSESSTIYIGSINRGSLPKETPLFPFTYQECIDRDPYTLLFIAQLPFAISTHTECVVRDKVIGGWKAAKTSNLVSIPQSNVKTNSLIPIERTTDKIKGGFVIAFNPANDADMTVIGGENMDKVSSFTVVIDGDNPRDIQTINDKSNFAPMLILQNMNQFFNEITYIVLDTSHSCEISEIHTDMNIILLLNDETKTNFYHDKFLVGDNGVQFNNFNDRKEVRITFNSKTYLSGTIQLRTKLRLDNVRADKTYPPEFQIARNQKIDIQPLEGNFTFSFRTEDKPGQPLYKLGCELIVKDIKSRILANQNTIQVFMKEEIFNELNVVNDTLNKNIYFLLEDRLSLKKLDSSTKIEVHVQYSFNDKIYAATIKFYGQEPRLTLKSVTDPTALLKNEGFIYTVLRQKFTTVTFYDLTTKESQILTLDAGALQFVWNGIRYQWDAKIGLVAKPDKISTQADFSKALTDIIACPETPIRTDLNVLQCGSYKFFNVPKNTRVLTPKGESSFGLLPTQLSVLQEGDIIRVTGSLKRPVSEIDHVSLKSNAAGAADRLVIHYHAKPTREKRDITESEPIKNPKELITEVYFAKKIDSLIPKNVEFDGGEVFPIDFSGLSILTPGENILTHIEFENLKRVSDLQLHIQKINGETLVQVPGTRIIFRVAKSPANHNEFVEILDENTHEKLQILLSDPETAEQAWSYVPVIGVASCSLVLAGIKALFNSRATPARGAAAAPLLALGGAATEVFKNVVKEGVGYLYTSTKKSMHGLIASKNEHENVLVTNALSGSWIQRPTDASNFLLKAANDRFNQVKVEAIEAQQPNQSTTSSIAYITSQIDAIGSLHLLDLLVRYRSHNKLNKSKALGVSNPFFNKDFPVALEIANGVVKNLEGALKEISCSVGMSFQKIGRVVDFPSLSINLINTILANNVPAFFETLMKSIEGAKDLNLSARQKVILTKKLENFIKTLVDEVVFKCQEKSGDLKKLNMR